MQQPSSSGYGELQIALNPIVRQLERLEDRVRSDMDALRKDMEKLRDDLVTKDALKPQLDAMEGRLKALEDEKVSRVERFWMRFGTIISLGIGIIALLELLTHFHLP